ncbi:unnamed protein product [Rotaria magnacalcarata]
MDLIADKLQKIPCWIFFDCLYKIIAYLDKPIALKLYPVIKRIVKLYPQLIVHPFKLSYETLQYSIQDPILKHNLELIQQQLNRYILLVNEFIEALNQLNPQQQFDIWSKELFHLLTNDVNTKDIDKLKEHLIKLKNILFSNIINLDETNDEQSMLSNTQDNNNDIDNTLLKPKITSIRILFKNACEKEFNDLFGKNGELLSTISLGDTRLILDKSSIHELEIPEQYTSKKKPLIEHHIKIVGFDEKLLVLDSLRLPKRITIRGHDENNYRFLVKAGEDIRQDQRIEALFSIMNDLYDNDPNYNQSNSDHIAVRTYKVIPMSSKFGMIEWLDNIRPLKDLIEESYNDSELDIITNQVNSHEGFYTLRRQFITSYAVLCTSQYILGTGDRHQSNFVLLYRNILITVGLFRATIIRTMNALCENSDLLLSTMGVFIKEPLMEWMEYALKTSKQVARNGM